MTPTIIDGMANADYHAHQALGSTSLKTLATRTPAHYKWDSEHPKHSDAFNLGTAVHSLVLESDESAFTVVNAANWMTKAAKEAKEEAHATGCVPLLIKDYEQVKAMRDAIMAHPRAKEAFTGHIAERSIFWEEDGVELKCRPDALNLGAIIDLKTTRNADPNEFGRTATDFGYFQSAAHYQDGVKLATGEELPFIFVLAEKERPYLVSVVELDDDALDYGRQMNDRAKRIYRECIESGNWPGYPKTEPVSLPMWAIYKMDDLLGLSNEEADLKL